MYATVSFKRGRLPERLPADLATVRPRSDVTSHVSDQRGFVPEPVLADGTGEWPLSRMSPGMISEMDPSLELLSTLQAIEVSDIIVLGSHVSLEATRFAETFVAILAPDLSSDAVSSEVVTQRVSVRVTLVADVALCFLSLVRVLVNSGSRTVVEPCRTPIAKISSVEIRVVTRVTL